MAKNRIKELRTKKGLSQSQLANELGISNQIISFYENDKREPKIEMWQKLADFFGVSVPYLQGIEPDFLEVTKQVRIALSLTLNNYYFGYKNNNYSLTYEFGKEIFTIANDKEKWNTIFSKGRYQISKSEARELYDYVNKYFELTGKKIRSVTGIDSITNYWMKELNFLLQDERLIRYTNRDLFRLNEKSRLSSSRIVYTCDRFANRISKSIYQKIISDFSTDLGKYIDQRKYRTELGILENNFDLALRTADSIQNMRETIDDYKNALNAFVDKIQLDESKGKVAVFIKRDKDSTEFFKKIDQLYKEFDELYSKDKDFKEFAKNYEEKHQIVIKEETGETKKVDSIFSVFKTRKLLCLYMYKHKKGENTAKLYELLVKMGVL